MAISFNDIPTAIRVPFTYVEFDSSGAVSGSSIQPYKILVFGLMLSGTAAANVPVLVTSDTQAATLFGAASQIASILRKVRQSGTLQEIWAIPQAEDAAGTAAIGSISFVGPATADGVVSVYVGNKLYSVAVLSGDAATAIATKVIAAIQANTQSQVNAVVDGTSAFKVNLTYKSKGLIGNDLKVQLNYLDEPSVPGVTATIIQPTGGLLNPTIASAITALGDEQYRTIAFPYNDAANLTLLETELTRRWGPLTQNDGHAFIANTLSTGAAQTFGLTRNSAFVSSMNVYGSPTPPWEIAGALAAAVSTAASIDPARPMQTLLLAGVLAPRKADRQTLSEKNTLLYSGVSTARTDANGGVRIEKLITMYRKSSNGTDDTSYLEYTTVATLSYLRYDFRTYFGLKYPRHKLADDGNKFSPGQAIMTPLLGKSEAVAKYRNWMDAGLVENYDAFKASLVVERNASNRNRLDFFLAPDLINGLDIIAAKIAFIV